MPEPTRMAEEVQGAVTREEELPIPRFSQLSADEIRQQLRTLSQSDLTVIEGYERTHAKRPGVLDAIEQLRGSEPWDGYDTMNPDRITAGLHDAPSSVARQVLEYEQRHRQHETVISAAEARTAQSARRLSVLPPADECSQPSPGSPDGGITSWLWNLTLNQAPPLTTGYHTPVWISTRRGFTASASIRMQPSAPAASGGCGLAGHPGRPRGVADMPRAPIAPTTSAGTSPHAAHSLDVARGHLLTDTSG